MKHLLVDEYKVRKLLKKKKVTGAEFGRAFILTRLQEKTHESVLAPQELSTLANKITGDLEEDIANNYLNFYTNIESRRLSAEAYSQQFYVGYSILFSRIHSTLIAEQKLRPLRNLTKDKEITNSDYQELKKFTENALFDLSLFAYWNNKIDQEFIRERVEQVKVGLAELMSFNKVIDLVTNYLQISHFAQMKIDTEKIYGAVEMLNNKVSLLRGMLFGHTPEENQKKRRFLDEFYPTFDLSDYEPTEESIKKASILLGDYPFQQEMYEIFNILTRKS